MSEELRDDGITVDGHGRLHWEGKWEPPDRDWYSNDVEGQSARARDSWHSSSPHVIKRVSCALCSRNATYYGRVDELEDPFLCDRCEDDE